MGSSKNTARTLIVYTSDVWEHVCPVIRILRPAELAGFKVVHGNEWKDGDLKVYPERVQEGDLVIIQRDFPSQNESYEQVVTMARKASKPVIYELDDLLVELPEAHPDYLHYISARSGILRAIIEADAVITSSAPLREYAAQLNPISKAIPNYLDDGLWKLRASSHGDRKPIVIGYMGGHSHAYDFQMISSVLRWALEQYGDQIAFKFWGLQPPREIRNWRNVEWINVGLVRYQDFVAYFQAQICDIFLAPLCENLFNQCKSHLKYLEYSALATPGIFSKVTPFEGVVNHGENGLLAGSEDEWKDSLKLLIEDPSLRFRMGESARDTVKNSWLLSDHIEEWAETYNNLLDSGFRVESTSLAVLARRMQRINQDLEDRISALVKENRQLFDENQRLRQGKRSLEIRYQVANQQFFNITHSRSWKALTRFNQIRSRWIPPASFRERFVLASYRSLNMIIHGGVRTFPRRFLSAGKIFITGIRKPGLDQVYGGQGIGMVYSLIAGDVLQLPAISVVVFVDGKDHYPSPNLVQAWLEKQTLRDVELVVWEKQSGEAYRVDDADHTWEAVDGKSLCRGLTGRYLCLASFDLIQQHQGYLEYNLIALETAGLAFTVNLMGQSDWAIQQIQQGYLPGDDDSRLLRQIVAKDFVTPDFSLDLLSWSQQVEGHPAIAGRILRHTTNFSDREGELPFRVQLPVVDWAILGQDLLVRSGAQFAWENAPRVLHPIETALPIKAEHTNLPTVILIHTYLAVGGAEEITLKLLQELKDEFRFIVLAFDPLDPSLGTTADAFRAITPYVYNLPDFLNEQLNGSLMDYLISRFDPGMIYIANGATWIFNSLQEIKRKHPQIRIANQVYDYQVGWINRYDLSLVANIDVHIGANKKILQAYIYKGVAPEQTYLIENGVDSQELDPADYPEPKTSMIKARLGLPLNKRIVTFASRIHPQKRPLDFIELARRFSTDPDIFFLMVGDGPLAGKVNEQVKKIGLNNFIHHPFYRPISDILAISDVIVLPSEFEGMPMIVTEAQAMGKPVVVTDVGNNREVLEYTGGGVVVSSLGDIASLMEGVRRMLANPPDPEQLRKLTLDRFSNQLAAKKYRDVFSGGGVA